MPFQDAFIGIKPSKLTSSCSTCAKPIPFDPTANLGLCYACGRQASALLQYRNQAPPDGNAPRQHLNYAPPSNNASIQPSNHAQPHDQSSLQLIHPSQLHANRPMQYLDPRQLHQRAEPSHVHDSEIDMRNYRPSQPEYDHGSERNMPIYQQHKPRFLHGSQLDMLQPSGLKRKANVAMLEDVRDMRRSFMDFRSDGGGNEHGYDYEAGDDQSYGGAFDAGMSPNESYEDAYGTGSGGKGQLVRRTVSGVDNVADTAQERQDSDSEDDADFEDAQEEWVTGHDDDGHQIEAAREMDVEEATGDCDAPELCGDVQVDEESGDEEGEAEAEGDIEDGNDAEDDDDLFNSTFAKTARPSADDSDDDENEDEKEGAAERVTLNTNRAKAHTQNKQPKKNECQQSKGEAADTAIAIDSDDDDTTPSDRKPSTPIKAISTVQPKGPAPFNPMRPSTPLTSDPTPSRHRWIRPIDPLKDLSRNQANIRKFHLKALHALPRIPLASHRYWIGILNVFEKPTHQFSEKSFTWMRGNRLTTVETVWHVYAQTCVEEGFTLVVGGGVERPGFEVRVEELDYCGDRRVFFRAAKDEDIKAGELGDKGVFWGAVPGEGRWKGYLPVKKGEDGEQEGGKEKDEVAVAVVIEID